VWTAETQLLPQGSYTLQLFGDADKKVKRPAITGVNGQRLDGETPKGPLPSGNGVPGGKFIVKFNVTG
jgi:hypothetical protein